MKKVFTSMIALVLFASIGQAQALKEEEFVKSFFEILKKGDKKELADKILFKESDLEAYNANLKALGSTKEFSKDEFAKFIDDKNRKVIREFDDLIKHATTSKITWPDTKFFSYRKIADPTAEVNAGYYKIVFKVHETYTFKIQLEAAPVGEGLRMFNLMETVTM